MDLNQARFAERQDAEQQERLMAYKRAYEYYTGKHKLPLPVRDGEPNDNVILNIARIIVDKGAAFLFGKEPIFELEEGATSPAEKALAEFWDRNHKMTFLNGLAISGGLYGHMFGKLLNEEPLPRIVNMLPEYMTTFWDGDDIDSVWRYRIQWTAADRNGEEMTKRQDIELDDGAKKWKIKNQVAMGNGGFKQDPDNPDMTWKWEWCPIVSAPNMVLPGSFYGQSDLDDLSEQDAINYIASKMQRITRYHAHPKTIGTGFAKSDIQISEDDMLVLPNPEAKIWNLEMQSDLASSMGLMDRFINWYLAAARIPRLDPASVSVGALSGFALKVLYGELIEKTNTKHNTYGDFLIEANRRVLDMMKHGDKNYTTLHWPDPLPEDEDAEKTRDEFELANEIAARETIQRKRGYTPKDENVKIDADQARDGNVGAMLVRSMVNQTGSIQRQEQTGEL